MPDRDLFANFERMRREVDELFGDVFERTGLTRRREGFSPAVDVFYCGDAGRAVITAELPGVDPRQLSLEIHGRRLILSGQRPPVAVGRDDVYQQIEIERGPFRRVVELAEDVDAGAAEARYEQGMLRVELPLRAVQGSPRTIPIEVSED